MNNWPNERRNQIQKNLTSLFERNDFRFMFHTTSAMDKAWGAGGYLPEEALLKQEIQDFSPDPFQLHSDSQLHILICTGAKQDAQRLWELREKLGEHSIICLWLWDNHWGHIENISCALAADFVFVSHDYVRHYLFQPASVIASHIPACSAQWTHRQATQAFSEVGTGERISKALVNYVAYSGASPLRQRLLQEYQKDLASADVFLMQPNDRSRYSSLSPADRFNEWARYKTTIILPVDKDLSTRVFDSLLAGQVPIVPNYIEDFDAVISPATQKALGIVRTDSLEVAAITEAIDAAVSIYDDGGIAGAHQRHTFALENHMLVNRITDILYVLWRVGTGELTIDFATEGAPGLYLAEAMPNRGMSDQP